MIRPENFDPIGFLQLAKLLALKDTPDQAELRTAISRAYYAVHLHARERLAATGAMKSTRTGRDHQLVIETLRRAGGPQGDQVDRLRVERNCADYELQPQISTRRATQVVTLAESVWPRL